MPVRLSVRSRTTSLAATVIAAAVALACVAGCSSSSSGGAKGTTGGTAPSGSSSTPVADASSASTDSGLAHAQAELTKYEATRNTFAEIAKIANVPNLKGKTVWYIPIGNSVPILSTIGTGMSAALATLGANVHVCDGNFLPTTIASCMNTAANQGADAVVTGFVDYALIPTAFNNLVSHHIPVLVGGEQPSGGRKTDKQLAFFDVSAEAQQAFKLMSDAVVADSKGVGRDARRSPHRLLAHHDQQRPRYQGDQAVLREVHRAFDRHANAEPEQARLRGQRGAGLEPRHQVRDRSAGRVRTARRVRYRQRRLHQQGQDRDAPAARPPGCRQ